MKLAIRRQAGIGLARVLSQLASSNQTVELNQTGAYDMARKLSARIVKQLEELDAQFAKGCAEPGYDDKPVILANWNNAPDDLFDKLECWGYAPEWSDEWIICDGCNKAFRTSPDSYGWEMYGAIMEGEAICGDCLNYTEYYESIENNPRRAVTCSLVRNHNPADYGYKLIKDEYENGFHPGQNDDPAKILKAALEHDPAGRFLFVIDGQGQFDIEFSLYRKITEE